MSAIVYVLQSERNGRYYIGSTNHLLRRYQQHVKGRVYTTARMLPVKLAGWKEFETLAAARTAERALKAKKSRVYIERFLMDCRCDK